MSKVIIIRPDKALRRRVLWVFVAATVLILWGVISLNQYAWTLKHSADPLDQARLLQLARWIIFGMPLLVFGLVGWIVWLARRIFETGQYPLPGQRVLRPTRLRTGPLARQVAWSLLVIGTTLLVLEMLLSYYALRILWSLSLSP